MALGRGSVLNTGLADQTANKRDEESERREALERKIAAYDAAGLDTKHLKRVLGGSSARHRTAEEATGAQINVPQPMEPGQVERGVPLSPAPDTVPEPEDGSAPDKRAQDQTPVYDNGVVARAKDPGPEGTKANALPVQPQPGEPVEAAQPRAVVKAQEQAAENLREHAEGTGPATGDETVEEAEARRKVANQTVPAPDVEPRPTQQERVEEATKDAPAPAKAPAKKAPAKKAAARNRGR